MNWIEAALNTFKPYLEVHVQPHLIVSHHSVRPAMHCGVNICLHDARELLFDIRIAKTIDVVILGVGEAVLTRH